MICVGPPSLGRRSWVVGLLATFVGLLGPLPGSVGGQVIPDTLPPPPDSLIRQGDSLELQEAPPDSINPQDTLPAARLPSLARPVPPGWQTGVWEWDRDAILGTRAITLPELLSEVPGIVLVRDGDFGTPVAVSAFGAGGARVRVFRDGLELLPLEGSVVDLSRVGMAGLRSVRVLRSVGELRIELESVFEEGGSPYSLVEAGTGDLNTNVLRGTFIHPRALGGVINLAIDRVDTQGPGRVEPGAMQGGWVRYTRPLWGSGVIALDYSSRGSDRGDVAYPPKASRADWSIRTRWSLLPGLVGDLHYSSSSLSTESPDTFDFQPEKRTQVGTILSFESDAVRARGRFDKFSGEGLPGSVAGVQLEASRGRFGGVSGEIEWESWKERSVTRRRVRAWTSPLFGFSLFGELGSGDWGLPYLPAPPPPDSVSSGSEEEPPPSEPTPPVIPGPRFSGTRGSRLGGQFQWRGIQLAGARVHVKTDSLFLMGLPSDRSGSTLPGGTRNGYEVSGRLPLYPSGMAVLGAYQWWDQADSSWVTPPGSTGPAEPLPESKVPWRYLPRQSYQASLSFHDTFYPTGNLEVWFDLGVQGRDPMAVPFLESVPGASEETPLVPATVPFYQSWFVRLQIRVVTVRVFFMWENFTIREANQDLPDRLLPSTRSLYGVRWTMRN